MAKSLDQVVSKWSNNAAAAQTAFTDGIQNTTVNPMQLAVANEQGYLAGVQAAVSSGLWRRKTASVTPEQWKATTVAKAGNYGNGIAAGRDKYAQSMGTWLPVIQQTAASAKAMPGQTLQQRIARSAYVATTLYNRKRGA